MTKAGTLVGYARCSVDPQDLAAQRQRLRELGVAEDNIYLDQGMTGTETERPALMQALAAVHRGDTLVAPKLERLARSVPDACAIGDDLAKRGITLLVGQQSYDPAQPMGKMFFDVLATIAEFEVDLLRIRSREGLTGLSTLAETLERLEFALNSPRVHGPYLGVLLCDIDDFASITESWGEPFGDVVLATLAVRTRQAVRQGDTVGRFGWDEALVLLPGVHSLNNVAQVAEKIRSRAEEPIHHSGVTIHTTLSIGGTLAVPGESIETLKARLRSAVDAAKQAGRNTVSCI
ncbi:MAG: recombinase family protein [Actinomycetia bacterium]|nr:recombinase family protein [Actinomycetes bacterium]MCH9701405.1 recombinase family protein [Actinomycetes bacterium]MCH9760889.1 recombinase family protein [Actinomycetes bacterium]